MKYVAENLFGIDGWNIAWYGVIITCGMILGVILASVRARQDGLKSDMLLDFVLFATPIAILCARAYYVIFEWESYADNLWSAFKIWEGGLAIYGGVIGGLLTVIFFCRYHHFPLMRFLDLVIPSLVLGQAIGRWGNFVNQEAFGNVVSDVTMQFFPYAVYIEKLQEWHQATFFYESAWNICLLIAMLLVSRKKAKTGIMVCMYFCFYGLGRFLIEGLRTDSLYLFPGLRVSQLLSLVLMCVGIFLWFWGVRKDKFTTEYRGKYRLS